MSKRKKDIFFTALLLLGSTLLSVLLFEAAIRLAFPAYHPASQILFISSPDGTPLGKKNETVRQRNPKGDYDLQISFNKYGFRDEKDLASSTGQDWFALGDSFSMGWGVESEERFANVLQSLLGVGVYNIAIPGDFNVYRKLLNYARRNGAEVENLIIGVCMENDLKDYDRAARKDPGGQPKDLSFIKKVRVWGKTHSAAYLFLSYELQRNPSVRSLMEKIGVARKFDDPELLNRNMLSDDAIESSVDMLTPLLENVENAVFLIIPSRALWRGDNQEKERYIHKKFVDLLTARSFNVVDMKPVLEASGSPMDYYFKSDPHWIPKGHELAGEALFREISRLNKNAD